MKPKYNPTIKTLVKNFEFIEKNSPCPINSIPYSKVSIKWYWSFKDLGYFNVTRSNDDGRIHLVSLIDEGRKFLEILKKIADADHLKIDPWRDYPVELWFNLDTKDTVIKEI